MSALGDSGEGTDASALTAREHRLASVIAERVVALLRPLDPTGPPAALVDADAVAQALGVSAKSVYRHADKLGAVRVGRRLRFDLDRVLESWAAELDDRCPSERSQPLQTPAPKRTSDTGQRSPDTTHCQLLPVGRRTGAL